MPKFSWIKAKEHLSQVEIERFAAAMLFVYDEVKVPYAELSHEVGTTPGSTSVLFGRTIKKLRDKECFIDGDDGAEAGASEPKKANSRKSPSKASTPRKRKVAIEGDEDDVDASPATKKGRGKAKNAAINEEVKDGGENDEEEGEKNEEDLQ